MLWWSEGRGWHLMSGMTLEVRVTMPLTAMRFVHVAGVEVPDHLGLPQVVRLALHTVAAISQCDLPGHVRC